MRRVIIILSIIVIGVNIASSCNPKHMTQEQRKKKQARRRKHNPDDCPKIDCD